MKLKQQPEDFQVEERTDVVPSERGAFAFYRLDKRNWTTPDASGALFHSFYRQMAARPDIGPAEALHAAQLEMIRSGDWRANPRYWGAFFVTGAQ